MNSEPRHDVDFVLPSSFIVHRSLFIVPRPPPDNAPATGRYLPIMAQLTHAAAYLAIEDHLDAVGQRVRGQRIVRGAALFVAAAVVSTWAAALAAHGVGQSRWTWAVLAAWVVALVAAAVAWVLRPLLMRAPAVGVARMLEGRVPGLDNGLTNAVLLGPPGRPAGQPVPAGHLRRGERQAVGRVRRRGGAVGGPEPGPAAGRTGRAAAAGVDGGVPQGSSATGGGS